MNTAIFFTIRKLIVIFRIYKNLLILFLIKFLIVAVVVYCVKRSEQSIRGMARTIFLVSSIQQDCFYQSMNLKITAILFLDIPPWTFFQSFLYNLLFSSRLFLGCRRVGALAYRLHTHDSLQGSSGIHTRTSRQVRLSALAENNHPLILTRVLSLTSGLARKPQSICQVQ